MIVDILEDLCTRIEAAGLAWGPFVLDGSSQPKRVTYGPVDADHLKERGLMLGWRLAYPVTEPLERPPISEPTLRNLDTGAGTVEIEPALEWASRLLELHVYMRETRPDHLRVGYDLPTSYLKNEERLFGALGRGRRDYTLTIGGIPRGYSTRFEDSPFISEPGLALHAVFRYRVTYPLTEGVTPIQAFVAKRIQVVHDLPPNTPVDLTAEPLTPPEPGRVTVVE